MPSNVDRKVVGLEALPQFALILNKTSVQRKVAKDDARLFDGQCLIQRSIVDGLGIDSSQTVLHCPLAKWNALLHWSALSSTPSLVRLPSTHS